MLALIAVRRSFLPNDPVILTLGLTVSAVFAASAVGAVLRLDRGSLAGAILLHPLTRRVGAFTYRLHLALAGRGAGPAARLRPMALHAAFGIRIVGQLCAGLLSSSRRSAWAPELVCARGALSEAEAVLFVWWRRSDVPER
jgi:hypothetical protein